MVDAYSDLKAAVVRELENRGDLSTQIAAACQSAISHYAKHKFWFTEEQTTAFTVNLQPSLALPTDHGWIDGFTITYTTYPIRLERRPWREMQELIFNTTQLVGQPTDYAVYADQIWFWPTPNGAYALTMYQNMQNAPPVADTDVTDWSTVAKAEELIRSRAVADVKIHILKRPAALEEFQVASQAGDFMAVRERIAYNNLRDFTAQRISSGKVKAYYF